MHASRELVAVRIVVLTILFVLDNVCCSKLHLLLLMAAIAVEFISSLARYRNCRFTVRTDYGYANHCLHLQYTSQKAFTYPHLQPCIKLLHCLFMIPCPSLHAVVWFDLWELWSKFVFKVFAADVYRNFSVVNFPAVVAWGTR